MQPLILLSLFNSTKLYLTLSISLSQTHTHTFYISLSIFLLESLIYFCFSMTFEKITFSDFYAFQSLIRRCCEEVRNHSDLSGRDIRQSTTTQQKNNISESSVSKILLNSHIGNILQFLSKGVICIFPQKLLLYQISREPSQLLFIKSHFWFHFRFILVKII
jgi:hypothetical protein